MAAPHLPDLFSPQSQHSYCCPHPTMACLLSSGDRYQIHVCTKAKLKKRFISSAAGALHKLPL